MAINAHFLETHLVLRMNCEILILYLMELDFKASFSKSLFSLTLLKCIFAPMSPQELVDPPLSFTLPLAAMPIAI